jgi:hypothetical protein
VPSAPITPLAAQATTRVMHVIIPDQAGHMAHLASGPRRLP